MFICIGGDALGGNNNFVFEILEKSRVLTDLWVEQ